MKKAIEYYQAVKSRAEINMCDGACYNDNGHDGKCEIYEVKDFWGKSWGLFSYCNNAVKVDRKKGFTVEEYDER